MRICMLGQSLYLMLLSYCFICSEIWEAIGTNDCFLEYRITCDDEEERASRRVYRGCIRSPTCKGCTSCVCFGCDICRFSDCSCQTCIDFTRNAKTWISGVIFSTWLFLSLVGFFMTIVVSWKPLPPFTEALCHALVFDWNFQSLRSVSVLIDWFKNFKMKQFILFIYTFHVSPLFLFCFILSFNFIWSWGICKDVFLFNINLPRRKWKGENFTMNYRLTFCSSCSTPYK